MSTPSPLHIRILRKTQEATAICSLELVAEDGASLPAFSAGSHVDVHLPGGLIRQYSLCNAPSETHRYLLGVLQDPASRGGSQAVHTQLAEGQSLTISPPRNHFALAAEAAHSLLLAGGIGITPLLSMAEHLHAQGADFSLHYCCRSADRAAFRQRLASAGFADRVHLHWDDGPAAQRLDLARVLATPAAGSHLYVCGPQGFMDAVLDSARAQGWPQNQVHSERFAAAPSAQGDTNAFSVRIASTGQTVQVAAEQSVVQALAAAGVSVLTSCEQGVCGTCLTRVLEGTPDHRDSYLLPEERASNDQFLPCCSRAKSPLLVLDL